MNNNEMKNYDDEFGFESLKYQREVAKCMAELMDGEDECGNRSITRIIADTIELQLSAVIGIDISSKPFWKLTDDELKSIDTNLKDEHIGELLIQFEAAISSWYKTNGAPRD